MRVAQHAKVEPAPPLVSGGEAATDVTALRLEPRRTSFIPRLGRTRSGFGLALHGAWLGAAYYVGTVAGYALLFPESYISVVWPPNTILLVGLLLSPPRQWPWLLSITLPVHLVAQASHGVSVSAAALYYTYDCVLVLTTAAALHRFGLGRLALESLRHTLIFLVVTTVTVAVASLVWSPLIVSLLWGGDVWSQWGLAFLSNYLPFLVAAPGLVIGMTRGAESLRTASLAQLTEMVALGLVLLVCGVVVFGIEPRAVLSLPAFFCAPLPLLLWAALRFGPGGLSLSFTAFGSMAISNAVAADAPALAGSAGDAVLWLQLFLLALYVPMLVLTSVVEERRGKEAALRENEARYRGIVEDQTELICRMLPDGTYTFVNGAYCRYFQSTPEDLLGRSFWAFLPPEQRPKSRAFLDSITVDYPVATIEHEVVAPGGGIRWQQWTDRGFFDEHGRIVEYQAVGRDITARKRSEEALEATRQQFMSLANHVPVHVWMDDEHHRVQFVNARYREYVGLTGDDLPDGWLNEIHPDDAQAYLAFMLTMDTAWASRRAPIVRRTEHHTQVRLRRHDGEYHWFDVIALPRFEGDRFVGYLGCRIDITERKRAEEEHRLLEAQKQVAAALREADRRKDEFLAMLAHELRNPLAPVSTALELMRHLELPDATLRWARDVMSRQVGQLTRLVDDLLDLSRITRGTINVQMEPLDLRSVLSHAVETSRPLIAERGHRFSTDVAPGGLRLRGDGVRLAQLVSNLLNNAAKYTDAGGSIHLSAQRDADDIVLSVRDDGVGIAPDMLERVFDVFVQVERSRDHAQGGLGIGLTLVKRLVELQGGTVEARSGGPGRGSEFVVRLPALIEAEPACEVAVDSRPLAGWEHGLRILVVDDNADSADAMARLLALEKHEVQVVYDGASALLAVERGLPDVVLLDLALPGMDGLQVAHELRRREDASRVLLVAMTGFGRDEDRRRTAEAGFDHHLVKPVDFAALGAVLAGSRRDAMISSAG